MSPPPVREFRVLFVCTGNSARSQMAEALLNAAGRGRFHAESAGSQPAARVNPYALETLREHGVPWAGHPPRGIDDVAHQPWDFVITVCDRAKEACPVFPGQPVVAHWGQPDPAEVEGDDAARRRAFRDAFVLLKRRIDLLLALPVEQLERLALEARVRAIGDAGP
ncbi:MAG TPA: arsenate reductase ArsC [Gemmatimonadales bacterium]|nr:arsenate reductase ArsC [Gemmatimonadales bacterium]